MKVEVAVEKRHVYVFGVLTALVLGGLLVNAFGTSNPSVFGHTLSELEGTACSGFDKLTVNSTGSLACATDQNSGGTITGVGSSPSGGLSNVAIFSGSTSITSFAGILTQDSGGNLFQTAHIGIGGVTALKSGGSDSLELGSSLLLKASGSNAPLAIRISRKVLVGPSCSTACQFCLGAWTSASAVTTCGATVAGDICLCADIV